MSLTDTPVRPDAVAGEPEFAPPVVLDRSGYAEPLVRAPKPKMFDWVKESRTETYGLDEDLDDFHEFGMDVFPMRPTRKVRLPWLKFIAALAVLGGVTIGAAGYLTGQFGDLQPLQPILGEGHGGGTTTALPVAPTPTVAAPTPGTDEGGEDAGDENGEGTEANGAAGEETGVRVAFAATGANMRANSSENSQVIAVLPSGTQAEITGDTVNGWVPINFGGQTGWVWGSLVQIRYADGEIATGGPDATGDNETAAPEPEFDPDFESFPAHIRNGTNIRPAPSINNQPLRVAPRGAEITVIGPVAGGWVPIEFDGTRGYVAAQNVDLTPASN